LPFFPAMHVMPLPSRRRVPRSSYRTRGRFDDGDVNAVVSCDCSERLHRPVLRRREEILPRN
jgi:hypothetical protein